jgi:hypothetical protein
VIDTIRSGFLWIAERLIAVSSPSLFPIPAGAQLWCWARSVVHGNVAQAGRRGKEMPVSGIPPGFVDAALDASVSRCPVPEDRQRPNVEPAAYKGEQALLAIETTCQLQRGGNARRLAAALTGARRGIGDGLLA